MQDDPTEYQMWIAKCEDEENAINNKGGAAIAIKGSGESEMITTAPEQTVKAVEGVQLELRKMVGILWPIKV